MCFHKESPLCSHMGLSPMHSNSIHSNAPKEQRSSLPLVKVKGERRSLLGLEQSSWGCVSAVQTGQTLSEQQELAKVRIVKLDSGGNREPHCPSLLAHKDNNFYLCSGVRIGIRS